MSTTKKSKNVLSGKDLITIGIFSALYFVLNFIVMISGGLSPYLWLLMPGIVPILTGVPFMIMVSKVQKTGAVFIMGAITGLLYFITAQFTTIILLTFGISCVAAEIARKCTKYNSYTGNTIAFVFFSMGMIGSPLPVWLFKDEFLKQILEQGMPESYVTNLESIASVPMLIVFLIAPVIGAIIGSVIAKSMFKKHFIKAGIV